MKSLKLVNPIISACSILAATSHPALATDIESIKAPYVPRSQPISINKNTSGNEEYLSCSVQVSRHIQTWQWEKDKKIELQQKVLEAYRELNSNALTAMSLCREVIYDNKAGRECLGKAKYILAQALYNTKTDLEEAANLFQETMANEIFTHEERAYAKYYLADLKKEQDPQTAASLCQEIISDKVPLYYLEAQSNHLLDIVKRTIIRQSAEKLLQYVTTAESWLKISTEEKTQFASSYRENKETHFSTYLDVFKKIETPPTYKAKAQLRLAKLYEGVEDTNAIYLYRELAHNQQIPSVIRQAAKDALSTFDLEDDSCIIS